jgi:Ca-activated chloride channel family protein
LPENQFDMYHFKPLNVTFVIDISSSMKIGDRLELMKFALHQLSSILRKEDQLSIVSYATEAEVLLNTTSGDKKEKLTMAISSIKAGGMTAGGEGIKLGCKLNAKTLNTDGENLIYIITDGAFNKDSKIYMESIDKYKDMGIRISVVGIQNTPHDAINMQKIAMLGGGDYISIHRLADAEKALIHAVRKACYRK